MNSVEPVHTALRLGQPDRVPVIENLIAEPELVRVTMDKVLRCNMRIVQRAISTNGPASGYSRM
jgi:hypothetical protein